MEKALPQGGAFFVAEWPVRFDLRTFRWRKPEPASCQALCSAFGAVAERPGGQGSGARTQVGAQPAHCGWAGRPERSSASRSDWSRPPSFR